jgi:Ca2+ transporting ATPase
LQLRVVRAFKSTLEDMEERRSIHSLRSLRNLQQANQNQLPSSLLYSKNAFLKSINRDQSPPGNITIQVPTSRPHEPLNIHDINARYIDDDDVEESNDKTKETKI